MNKTEIKKIVEALLFASPEPLTQSKVNGIFSPDSPNLKKIIEQLNIQYNNEDHAFEIRQVSGGYQLVSSDVYEPYIRRMLNRAGRISLSSASMDSLSIIAYKQPISRYEIEAIRGVDSSGVLKTLLGKKLIKIKGRDNGPGRPLLYQTTNTFLEYFGINRLSDLPKLKEITELMDSDPNLGEQIAVFENESVENDSKDEQSPEIVAG